MAPSVIRIADVICRCDLYLHDKATSDKQAISGVELMSDTPLDVVEAMEQAYRTGP